MKFLVSFISELFGCLLLSSTTCFPFLFNIFFSSYIASVSIDRNPSSIFVFPNCRRLLLPNILEKLSTCFICNSEQGCGLLRPESKFLSLQIMRARRGKLSEAFWPSIVMRKWLNIKPKVHEFSEDEVDTESEDEDVESTRADMMFRILGSKNARMTQASGPQTKGPSSLRRRKSETLRVQYISKKDVRVMIGTWNVAGRVPFEDLELDEWLYTGEPAEMYILGFQEVVPLNAGNVLGAEDNRPIPKWEHIIRRTLNKPLQPKRICKSYSAPPSPMAWKSIPTDTSVDTLGAPRLVIGRNETTWLSEDGALKGEDESELMNLEKKFRCSRINASDGAKLDWPEHSLDAPPQSLTSGTKLRRVMSGSPRTGFDWLESSQIFASHDLSLNVGLKRVYHSSGNLGMLWSDQQEASDVLNSLNDASEDFSEEEDPLSENVMEKCESKRNRKCSKPRARYVRIVSKQMVGIYISVWVCRSLRSHINNLKVSPVGVGLMGYMGNKGSVSVSMSLFQTRLCFVCSHLTSGHKEGDQQKRNSDVHDILQRTQFSSILDVDQPRTIPSHDRIFWFGDLNYRLNLADTEVRELVAMERWDELMNYDQLSNERRNARIFDGWEEGPIDFPPTYKYEINSNRYIGEKAREGEKRRSPAWCDRILWLGKGINQLSYWRSDIRLSDHRPVSAIFTVEVEVFDQWKLQRALNFTNGGLLRGDFRYEENG